MPASGRIGMLRSATSGWPPTSGLQPRRQTSLRPAGERLVVIRARLSRSDEKPGAFYVDLLWLVETDTDQRATAWVTFDLDDFEAAIIELDARYIAGEAAAHANVLRPVIDTMG